MKKIYICHVCGKEVTTSHMYHVVTIDTFTIGHVHNKCHEKLEESRNMMEQIESKNRRANKEHKCDYCQGIIKKGEVYNWQKNCTDGTLYEWKNHLHCGKLVNKLNMEPYDEGIDEEIFREYVDEAFDEDFTLAEKAKLLSSKLLEVKS
jgi:hypothetical protein